MPNNLRLNAGRILLWISSQTTASLFPLLHDLVYEYRARADFKKRNTRCTSCKSEAVYTDDLIAKAVARLKSMDEKNKEAFKKFCGHDTVDYINGSNGNTTIEKII